MPERRGRIQVRGAFNALSRLNEEARRRGVLAYSSGNHAQAVALAGQLLGVPALIVCRRCAAGQINGTVRRRQTRRCADLSQQIARDASIIPPYDHPDIVAGQGTAAKELFEGSGGSITVRASATLTHIGCAIAADALSPGCQSSVSSPKRRRRNTLVPQDAADLPQSGHHPRTARTPMPRQDHLPAGAPLCPTWLR